MRKSLTLLTLVVTVCLSATAFAGTWSSPTVYESMQVTNTMNLASVAGTSNTSPASGGCNSGQVHYYFQTSNWQWRMNMGRGALTVYRQTCN